VGKIWILAHVCFPALHHCAVIDRRTAGNEPALFYRLGHDNAAAQPREHGLSTKPPHITSEHLGGRFRHAPIPLRKRGQKANTKPRPSRKHAARNSRGVLEIRGKPRKTAISGSSPVLTENTS